MVYFCPVCVGARRILAQLVIVGTIYIEVARRVKISGALARSEFKEYSFLLFLEVGLQVVRLIGSGFAPERVEECVGIIINESLERAFLGLLGITAELAVFRVIVIGIGDEACVIVGFLNVFLSRGNGVAHQFGGCLDGSFFAESLYQLFVGYPYQLPCRS